MRVPPMGLQTSIKFSCLFERERRLIAIMGDAFPERLDKFYSLCERKALYSIYEVRTHG